MPASREHAGRGIRVNGIAPGATVTSSNEAWIQNPDEAAYLTGQTLYVDEGFTLAADFRGAGSA